MKTLKVAESLREMERQSPERNFLNHDLLAFANGVKVYLAQRRGSVRVMEPGSIYIVRFDEFSGFCLMHAAAAEEYPETIGLSLIGLSDESASPVTAQAGSPDFEILCDLLDATQEAAPFYPPDLRMLASNLVHAVAGH